MKTAFAYARFSSDNQREESIDAQLRAIREYCEHENIVILRTFTDSAFSARTAKRPGFQELFGFIKEHPADLLVVHKLDRFARNRADAAFYKGKLREAGMKLVSVLEPMDDGPESIILEGVLESINEYYSANLSRETKKGLRENLLNGVRNGGPCPTGYIIDHQHLVPNADAPKVTMMFEMYADGKSYGEIEKATGWKKTAIRYMLANETYTGALGKGEEKHEGTHAALVDPKTWDLCQRRMKNTRMNAANRATHEYLLSGLCVCGKCGKTMGGLSSGSGHLYYYCRTKGCKSMRKEDLEGAVLWKLQQVMEPTPEKKQKFYEQINAKLLKDAEKLNEIKRANEVINKRITKILNAVQYADDEQAAFLLNQAKDLRGQLQEEPPIVQIDRETCDEYMEGFRDLQSKPYDEQKQIVRGLVDKILVTPEQIFCVKHGLGTYAI